MDAFVQVCFFLHSNNALGSVGGVLHSYFSVAMVDPIDHEIERGLRKHSQEIEVYNFSITMIEPPNERI